MSLRVGTLVLAVALGWSGVSTSEGQTFQFPNRPFGISSAPFQAAVAPIHAASAEAASVRHRFWLDYDRNAAWPVPFNEMDRETYHAWFRPCIERGWELEQTLSDACFDSAGYLNSMGIHKVTQAMRSAPSDHRVVYVYALSEQVAAARAEAVRQHLQVEFGRSANLMVNTTRNFPVTGRGSYAEAVTRAFQENLPPPVLNAQAISGAVGGEQQ
jgi:hypothetical protein